MYVSFQREKRGLKWSLFFFWLLMMSVILGLRQTINDEGVWRIRRLPKAREIEVWRVEETGHGEILTEEFMNWRIKLEMRQQAEKQAQNEDEDGQMAVES